MPDSVTIGESFFVQIRCRTCGSELARVREHRLVSLEGGDSRVVIDTLKGTVTVKCQQCGTGRVITPQTQSEYQEDLSVWTEEDNGSNSNSCKSNDAFVNADDGSDGKTK